MRDIESLKNISPYICVPLFTIACVKDGFLIDLPIENEVTALVIRFIIFAVIVYIAFMYITEFIFRYATYGNYNRSTIETMPLPLIVGFICIGFGLYGVGSFIPGLELLVSPLNIFWHLGLLSYGFLLLS